MTTGVPVNRRIGAKGALAALHISAASNRLTRREPPKETHGPQYRSTYAEW